MRDIPLYFVVMARLLAAVCAENLFMHGIRSADGVRLGSGQTGDIMTAVATAGASAPSTKLYRRHQKESSADGRNLRRRDFGLFEIPEELLIAHPGKASALAAEDQSTKRRLIHSVNALESDSGERP